MSGSRFNCIRVCPEHANRAGDWYRVRSGRNWGILDRDLSWVVPCRFRHVRAAQDLSGVFTVENEEGRIGFYRAARQSLYYLGKELTAADYLASLRAESTLTTFAIIFANVIGRIAFRCWRSSASVGSAWVTGSLTKIWTFGRRRSNGS